jgi:hypothetical protein
LNRGFTFIENGRRKENRTVRKMEEELFSASDKEKIVKALGVKVNCNIVDLHIYVNGVDITKNVVLEEIRIVLEKKAA